MRRQRPIHAAHVRINISAQTGYHAGPASRPAHPETIACDDVRVDVQYIDEPSRSMSETAIAGVRFNNK